MPDTSEMCPNGSPSPSRSRTCPSNTTSTVPARTTYRCSAGAPACSRITVPAGEYSIWTWGTSASRSEASSASNGGNRPRNAETSTARRSLRRGGLRGLPDGHSGGHRIRRQEDRAAGHEDVRPGTRGERRGLHVEAAVDLDVAFVAVPVHQLTGPLDLREHLRDELLPAEPRVHAHHEQQVDELQVGLDLRERRRRVHRQGGSEPQRTHPRDERPRVA